MSTTTTNPNPNNLNALDNRVLYDSKLVFHRQTSNYRNATLKVKIGTDWATGDRATIFLDLPPGYELEPGTTGNVNPQSFVLSTSADHKNTATFLIRVHPASSSHHETGKTSIGVLHVTVAHPKDTANADSYFKMLPIEFRMGDD